MVRVGRYLKDHLVPITSFFAPLLFPAPRHGTLVTVFYPDEYTHERFLTASAKLESTDMKEVKNPYFCLAADTLKSLTTPYAESFTKITVVVHHCEQHKTTLKIYSNMSSTGNSE